MGDNCPGGSCPVGNYSKAIVWEVKVQGGISSTEIVRGQLSKG